ncbi:hypothetical protein [Streptomyces sp. YU58]|uniref:hypothetical protein n=1 Tax=Streptomyces sp. SX92 TaxID=3158972 RepID=UPI0027BAF3F1|nr:hypothetical protein [Streptomyces coralus]WLW52571.1 hypothetical protein QU709_14780 [Streptomyces coralus]
MSRPGGDGYGTEPQEAPNVYLPRGGSTPAYEAYTDPAAAHGWQSTYGETAELPAVADAPGVLPPTMEAPPERPVAVGRRSHRKRGGGGVGARRSRRIAVAAGAAGAVSAVALIAWFSFSGTSADAPSGNGRPAPTPAAGDTAAATDPGTPADTGSADRPSDGSGAAAPSDAAPTPASPTAPTTDPAAAGDAKPSSPAPTPTATSAAPTQAPATSAPGNSDAKPGRGQGASKGPK